MKKLFETTNDATLTVVRLVLGGVMFAHGAQNVLGWWGGHGFAATYSGFTEHMHIPAPFALLAIAAEFLGSLGLIVGLLGRVGALGLFVTMGVAALMAHLPNGLFMNWFGTQKGEGYEYHLLAMALAVPTIIRGSGALSLDALVAKAIAAKK